MNRLYRRVAPLFAASAVFLLALTGLAAIPCAASTVQMHPGISANELANAQIIKLQRGQSIGSLANTLRDDQIIEGPNGTHMSVGKVRALQAAFTKARQNAQIKRPEGFKIFPAPKSAGVPLKQGETSAQILARPDSDVVKFPSGRSASVAQLRAMAPYIKQHYGVDLANSVAAGRPNLSGAAIKIASIDDLKKIPKDAPASTVLESSKGTRISLGELRTAVAAAKPPSSSFKAVPSQGGVK